MSTNESELHQFNQFVAGKLQHGADLTPEQCLHLWRAENPNSPEYEENIRVIQQSIDEMETGEVSIDGDALNSQLRSKYSKAE